jgi:hypothetical protein
VRGVGVEQRAGATRICPLTSRGGALAIDLLGGAVGIELTSALLRCDAIALA